MARNRWILILFACWVLGAASAQTEPAQILTALTDLGTSQYHDVPGGLYPNGQNAPPAEWQKLGVTKAQRILPLGPDGEPDLNGKIVLLSVGMTNTSMEFTKFIATALMTAKKNPWLYFVDGAQGGQDAAKTADPKSDYWKNLDQRLTQAHVTPAQVQVIWLKQAILQETRDFPEDAIGLEDCLKATIDILQQRFPNLQLVYLSSRAFGGYAVTKASPEPYAYDGGFAVKWLIEDRIKAGARGEQTGPWVGWGPYLWTNGDKGRKDGFTWLKTDVANDGIRPSDAGMQKVADQLLKFFQTDETAKVWFMER